MNFVFVMLLLLMIAADTDGEGLHLKVDLLKFGCALEEIKEVCVSVHGIACSGSIFYSDCLKIAYPEKIIQFSISHKVLTCHNEYEFQVEAMRTKYQRVGRVIRETSDIGIYGAAESNLIFVSPKYGAILSGAEELLIHFKLFNFLVPQQGYLLIDTNKDGSGLQRIDSGIDSSGRGILTLTGLEPGTHSLTVYLVSNQGKMLNGDNYINLLFDVVPASKEGLFLDLKQMPSRLSFQSKEIIIEKEQISLGFVGSTTLDGQKSIWFQQFALLPKTHYHIRYISFSSPPDVIGAFQRKLQVSGIHISYAPLEVASTGVYSSADELFEALIRQLQVVIRMMIALNLNRHRLQHFFSYSAASQRCRATTDPLAGLLAAAGSSSDTQLLAKRQCSNWVYQLSLLFLPSTIVQAALAVYGELCGLDVVVYANSRSVSDGMITLLALIAEAKAAVMELPNLFPHPMSAPLLAIAPSHFAAMHQSVALAGIENVVVVNPGVNIDVFAPRRELARETRKELVVAFVARVASEKSPGLFLHLAARMKRHAVCHRRNCSFLVIGAGLLKLPLEHLSLHLGGLVNFTGPIYGDLPSVLNNVDVIVNPSLRAVSETFCIVNMEAMAMGIPIVSFGVGGIREYLEHRETGILVDEFSVQGLLDGVLLGIELRREISLKARRKAVYGFNVSNMVNRYSEIYSRIMKMF